MQRLPLAAAASRGMAAAAAGMSSGRLGTAQCRAEQSSVYDAGSGKGATDLGKTAAAEAAVDEVRAGLEVTNGTVDDWVHATVDEANLADAVHNILAVVAPDGPRSDVQVREVTSDDDETSSVRSAWSADGLMAAADARLECQRAVRADFERALTGLLNNRGVRTACMDALKEDPDFANLLRSVGSGAAEVDVDALLPLAARAATRGAPSPGRGDPLLAFIDTLGAGLDALGRHLEATLAATGRVVINIGYRVRRLLNAPFGTDAAYRAPGARRPTPDAPLGSPELWQDLLVTMACAVVALLVAIKFRRRVV